MLQKIQDRYGTIEEFELRLMGWEKDENGKVHWKNDPDMELINWILPELINEGTLIETGELPELQRDDINRMADMNPMELAEEIHKELLRAFESKKKRSQERAIAEESSLKGSISSDLKNFLLQRNS